MQVGCVLGTARGSSSPGCPVPVAPWAQHHPHRDGWGISYHTGISTGLEKGWSNSWRGLLINTCPTPVMCQTLHKCTYGKCSICRHFADIFARTVHVSCQAPAGSPVPPNQHPRHSAALPGNAGADWGAMGLSRTGTGEGGQVPGRWKQKPRVPEESTARSFSGLGACQEVSCNLFAPVTSVQKRDLPVPSGRERLGWHTGDQAAPRMVASPKGAQSSVGPALAGVSQHTMSSPQHCFTTTGLGREDRRAPCELSTASAAPPSPAIIL